MAEVLTINEALKRAQAEGIPLPETALRRCVKNGQIPAVYAGKKALIFWPNLVKFVCGGGDNGAGF